MLASGRTLGHRVFSIDHQVPCFRRSLKGDCDQKRAQRFFSACRASWRKDTRPTDRLRSRLKIDDRDGKFATGATFRRSGPSTKRLSEQETRRQSSRQNIVKLVVDRLKTLGDRQTGTEFSDLAHKIARQYQTGYEYEHSRMLHSFRQAYIEEGQAGLDSQIKYALQGQLANRKIDEASVEEQAKLADLRYPLEWYPGTRVVQRTIHLHVGPTNSGKTYHALKRLEQAKTGVYAGPLRLLAHEVYTRLNASGKKCHLITGDDRRINEEADEESDSMISCTVEMVPINIPVDVGVIDEIQMIGHSERGWAWSQALLGLKAKELHLCGEARTVPLIRELAAAMGDKLVLNHYERLSPLKAASTSLNGDLKQLRRGDCLVVFSRKEIHYFKSEIERLTGKRVAIVYGSLPPETRARQASLFNDPNNDYDYLVASDAIGMGLNLDIKRIIFESTFKFDGKNFVSIPVPHLKQIAGRAGRYRIAPQAQPSKSPSDSNIGDGLVSTSTSVPSQRPSSTVGLVTTLEQMDFPRIRRAMQTEAEPVMSAGIFPPTSVLVKFATYYSPGTPFSYILQRLHEISSLHPRYHLCNLKDQITIADMIEPVTGLTIEDRIIFCAAPAANRLPGFEDVVVSFAECVAKSDISSNLLDIPTLPLEILDGDVTMDRSYLSQLETLHKALILYIWLAYRFTGVFTSEAMAFYVKGLVEERIDKVLGQQQSSRKQKLKSLRQLAMLDELGGEISAKDEKGVAERLPKNRGPLALGFAKSDDGQRTDDASNLWLRSPLGAGHEQGESVRSESAIGA